MTALAFLTFEPLLPAQSVPVRGHLSAHDPGTMIRCKDRYYQVSSGIGIAMKSSADRAFWKTEPIVFASPPAWLTNAVPNWSDGWFWAPDIILLNNQYHLYYSVSSWGSQVSVIGLATNPTLDPTDPNYLWTDRGQVIASASGMNYNTIDPSVVHDNAGNLWLVFGSYWNGIYSTQLNPANGLRITPNSTTYHLARNTGDGSIEAAYILRRGGYYYLFVNWGSCCSGVNGTYNIRVGRSASITGPYLDKSGVNMANGGGSPFLQGTGRYSGPGHMAVLSENGRQWFTYHYYDANSWEPGISAYGLPRFACSPLSWTADHWPVYTNDWSASYDFEAGALDDHGQYSGLLRSGASIKSSATYGHVLDLNGTNQYVWLPPGVAYGQTFSAVVNWRGGADWQRIFDFGTDTSKTFMLTPSGGGVLRCDINPGGNLQTIQWTQPLPMNVWTHVAVTLDGTKGVLYVNGAPVVTNTGVTHIPMNVAPQTNHLGRSKFAVDAYFNGQFASFRAHGRALSPSEIVAPQPSIVQPADGSAYHPGDVVNFGGKAADFASRPLASSNLTWRVDRILDGQTNTVYGPLNGVATGEYPIPASATDGAQYAIVLTATDSSNRQSSVTTTLSPANPPADWSSYFPFTTDAGDANGHFNGQFNGGASIVNDLSRGNVLNLSGSGQYVSFPSGVAGMQTFMAWVKWNGGAAWQRIFDMGTDTNRYTVLTPKADNGRLRFNISLSSIPGEQIVDGPAALPTNVWTHVAVVMDGSGVVLYTNGVPAATNPFANLVPANLNATSAFLGKSLWSDPYFSGRLSAVRIFSRALAASEIVAPQTSITQPAHGAVYHPGDTINFSGGARDFNDSAILSAGLTWRVDHIYSGVTNGVFGPASGITSGSFAVPTTGSAATNGYYQITLTSVDTSGRRATNSVAVFPAMSASSTWGSYYPFTSGAQDASNRFNGTLYGGASIVNDFTRGNVLNLSGGSQYVGLPAGASAAQTISGWVKWNGGSSWQRVFDFGNSPNQWFFLSPSGFGGLPQCSITADAAAYYYDIQPSSNFPVGQWTHVAVTLSGHELILAINGAPVAVNNSTDLLPSDIGATNCYLGRSAFSADPYFSGRMSAIRLNSRALPLEQIIAPMPVILQPTNGARFSGGTSLGFSGSATDYSGAGLSPAAFSWSGALHSNGVTYAAFGPLNGVTSGSYLVPTNLVGSTNLFYRISLTVTDAGGYPQSASMDVAPRTSLLTFATVPSGLQLLLDGQSLNTTTSLVAVAGMSRQVAAPSPQSQGGANYDFIIWSDGGVATHNILVPPTNSMLTASFLQPVVSAALGQDTIQLSWPDWAGAMSLVTATNLSPPVDWLPMGGQRASSNGFQYVTAPRSNHQQFYQLQYP